MAGLTLTLADAVLKEDYKAPVRKQINDKVGLLAQFDKNTEDLVGRRAIIPCHMTRNTGFGARLENEVLPAAGNQGTVDQIVPLRYQYGRMRLTKQVITRMRSDRGAFVRAVKLEMNGLVADATRDVGRQAWGTSDGKLATCGTTTASTTVQLATTTPEQALVNLAEGKRVDIGTVATPQAVAADRKVTAVDFTNKTVTIDGAAVTTTSSHFLFNQGAGGSGANQRELTGVQTQVAATGALFNIDPATYATQWASIVDSNSGTTRPISENLVEKTMHRASNRSGVDVNQLWAEDGVYRAAVNLLQGKQRVVNTLELRGGHLAVSFTVGGSDVPLMRDRDAPPNKLWGIATSEFVEYMDEDWSWEDEDGSVLTRSPDSTHTFEAYFYKFHEVATVRRNAHFLIDDLEAA